MKELVYINGPYDSYGEAREVWETDYCGEDGPYRVKEVRKDVFYIVTEAEVAVEENDWSDWKKDRV